MLLSIHMRVNSLIVISQFRSIGDEIAEDLGVIAEPEVIRRRIQPSDKVCIANAAHFPLCGMSMAVKTLYILC